MESRVSDLPRGYIKSHAIPDCRDWNFLFSFRTVLKSEMTLNPPVLTGFYKGENSGFRGSRMFLLEREHCLDPVKGHSGGHFLPIH